jgi:hypothetical protein
MLEEKIMTEEEISEKMKKYKFGIYSIIIDKGRRKLHGINEDGINLTVDCTNEDCLLQFMVPQTTFTLTSNTFGRFSNTKHFENFLNKFRNTVYKITI